MKKRLIGMILAVTMAAASLTGCQAGGTSVAVAPNEEKVEEAKAEEAVDAEEPEKQEEVKEDTAPAEEIEVHLGDQPSFFILTPSSKIPVAVDDSKTTHSFFTILPPAFTTLNDVSSQYAPTGSVILTALLRFKC